MKLLILFFLVFVFMNGFAQTNQIDMADGLYSNGRIYVVVVCAAIVMLGIILLLFSIDRRVSRLEKKSSRTAEL